MLGVNEFIFTNWFLHGAALCCIVLPFVALCCTVLHCVTVCCSVLQCVTVCGMWISSCSLLGFLNFIAVAENQHEIMLPSRSSKGGGRRQKGEERAWEERWLKEHSCVQ